MRFDFRQHINRNNSKHQYKLTDEKKIEISDKLKLEKITYALSRLTLQGVLYLQIYIHSSLLSEIEARVWNESFFIGTLLTLVACGERHLSDKNNWKNKTKDQSKEYLTWCSAISILFTASAFIFVNISTYIACLSIIIAVECLYSDIIRCNLLQENIKKASKVTNYRSAIHLTSIILLHLIDPGKILYTSMIGHTAVILYLLTRNPIDYRGCKNSLINQFRSYNLSFTTSALLARSTFVTDKLIVSFYTDINTSTKYALITGLASAGMGIIDNIALQPKILLIVNKDLQFKEKLEKYLRFITITVIITISTLISLKTIDSILHEPFSLIINTSLTTCSYLCLIIYSYKCTSERKAILIKISSILPAGFFYCLILIYPNLYLQELFLLINLSIITSIFTCQILNKHIYGKEI